MEFQNEMKRQAISSEVRFYKVEDIIKMTGWSENTVKKLRQILIRILKENDYLDTIKSDHINPVWLNPILENAIKNNNDDRALTAFNCFS